MTVTLNLKPGIEADLIARAQSEGMDLEGYLASLVDDALSAGKGTVTQDRARREAVRRMIEFGDKYQLSLGEAVTRRILHESHRY